MADEPSGVGPGAGWTRRRALTVVVGSVAAAGLAGCAGKPPAPVEVAVPLANLPLGQRLNLRRGDETVELLRTADGIQARSMLCPHTGCEVWWDKSQGLYRCRCHEGKFDAAGRVLAGPPPGPLRVVPTRIEGENLILLPDAPARTG